MELRRARLEECGALRTYIFSFPGRRRSQFIRPEHMPEADREGDWELAWYEIAKVDGVWTGLQRFARKYGDEPWTADSPSHAETGGKVPRPATHASTPPGFSVDTMTPT